MGVKLLRVVLRTLGWRYGAYTLAVILFGLLTLLPAQLFRFFTQGIHEVQPQNFAQFAFQLSLVGLAVAAASLISSMGNVLCQEWLRLKIESGLRLKVLERLQQLQMTELDGVQRGDWLTRMTGDLSRVELFLTESVPSQLRHLAIFIGTSALFVSYSGKFAFIPIVLASALALMHGSVQNRLTPVLAELRSLHGHVFQMLIESFEGLRTIRSQAAEPYMQRRFNARLIEITSKSMHVVKVMGALIGGTGSATQLMITGCLVVLTWALAQGRLSFDQVLIYPFFLGLFYSSVQGLASTAYDWNRYFIEGGRLANMLLGDESSLKRSAPHAMPDVSASQTLEIREVLIGYGSRSLTKPLNLQLSRGKICAMLGPSGCGKSTLLELIAGIRPAIHGRTQILDSLGNVIWESDNRSAPYFPIALCAYVEQSPYLFEGTLKENLILGNANRSSDAIIWRSLERVGLYEFTRANGGLDHPLHDRGRNLSEGERYRIALCRALLLNRPFLLLDEPFAALDERSVKIVCHTLERERQMKGILVVTHFIPESLAVDRILTLGKSGFEGIIQPWKRNGEDANAPVRVEETLSRVLPTSQGGGGLM